MSNSGEFDGALQKREQQEPEAACTKADLTGQAYPSGNKNTAVCIQGVPEYLKQAQVLKEIEKQASIPVEAIFKPSRKAYCFVKFTTKELKQEFSDTFADGIQIKNRNCKLKDYEGKMDVFRLEDNRNGQPKTKRVKSGKEAQAVEPVTLREKICPYMGMSKAEQADLKFQSCREILSKIKERILAKDCAKISIRQSWLKQSDAVDKIMLPIVYSDSDEPSYRNKTEYTISKDPLSGKTKIGFVVGRKPDFDHLLVDRDPEIPFISPLSTYITERIEELLNKLTEESQDIAVNELEAYNSQNKSGCFRFLLIKESEAYKECLVKLLANFSSDNQREIVKKELIKFGENFSFADFKLAGVLVENYNGLSSCVPNDPACEELVYGERSHIYEKVMDVEFKVPCGAFFQVHTKLSELLYKNISNLMEIDHSTVLLDICAGTGTMGLILGREAGEVVFVESEKSSCDTILENIKINEKENNFAPWKGKIKVLNKKIESCIDEITAEYNGKGLRIVAIVDPPRAGLHPDVVRSIRTFRGLDELIFISCDFSQASENLTKLCCEESKKCRGPPFSPLSVRPVNIFPDTNHYETIIHLKRLYE